MEPTIITPDIRMADMTRALNKLSTLLGMTPDQIKNAYKISYDLLRFEIPLKPNVPNYEVNTVAGNDNLRPLERKIASGHSFVVTSAGIVLHKVDYNSAAGTYSNEGTYPPFTFPDPAHFVGNPASGPDEWGQLLQLYNGKLTIKKDSEDIARIPLINSLKIPVGNYNSTAPITLAEFPADLEGSGILQRLYSQVFLDGSAVNRVILELAPGDSAVIDGSVNAAGAAVTTSRNFVSIILGGFYLEGRPESGVKCDSRM